MDIFKGLPDISPIALYLLFIWSLLWKGLALWKSAKFSQRNWFIGLLIINSMGILDIVYLFGFAKEKLKLNDLKIWESKK